MKEAAIGIAKIILYTVLICASAAFVVYLGFVVWGAFVNARADIQKERIFYKTSCLNAGLDAKAQEALRPLCEIAKIYAESNTFDAWSYHFNQHFWGKARATWDKASQFTYIIGWFTGGTSFLFTLYKLFWLRGTLF